jgi:hypothetical protein
MPSTSGKALCKEVQKMAKTSRRDLLKVAGAGSLVAGFGLSDTAKAGSETKTKSQHNHKPISGPLSSATVSFGQWPTDPPLKRFPNLGAPVIPNQHLVIPYEVTIKAGGAVNFIIAGFHLLLVYGDGTQKSDINSSLLVPGSSPPGLIDDPNNRIYMGLDPRMPLQDRVEVVSFAKPGRYLVICGVVPHFNDDMLGYVRVIS